MSKNKNITPQKKVKRLKFVMVIITLMTLFVLLRNKTSNESTESINPEKEMFDAVLDSLIKEVAPQGYTVTMLGEPVKLVQKMDSQYRGKIMSIEHQLASISNIETIDPIRKKEILNGLLDELELYQKQVQKEEADPRMTMTVDSRRVRFITTDGREYACFQQHFNGLHKLKWLIEVEKNITKEELTNFQNYE